jgi:NAD(P)-dependent dehydrogenase (short-subunit alcohol dehydrogenase family)
MKNILIIGGSSGIGFAAANLLSQEHQVFATYHSHPHENQPQLSFHRLNSLDENLSFDFLPDTIDALIYCPGSIQLKPFARIPLSDFEQDYKLNVGGAIKTIQSVLPKLKKSSNASIILFSTVAVQTGMSFHSIVSTSKGAVEGLTRALAAEFAPTVRVNCIAPSLTDTPLATILLQNEDKKLAAAQRHPMKRVGTANDLAQLVAFLVSDNSSWITGQIIHADGGMGSIK